MKKIDLKTICNIFLILVVFFLSAYIYISWYKGDRVTTDSGNLQKLPKSQLNIKINASAHFKTSTARATMGIENKMNNVYDIIVEIYLEDTNQLIYKSKRLKPGEKLEKIKLQKALKSGTYTAIAYFNAYEGNHYVGKSGAKINIKIGE